jgi:hypothetical protein
MARALQYFKNEQDVFSVKEIRASEIKISNFCHNVLSEHLYDALSKIPDRNWLVNISYKQGDTQLGLTGKVHRESVDIKDDVSREIQEETGLVSCKFDLDCVSGEKGLSVYTLNLNNSIAYIKAGQYKKVKDRFRHRVGVIVHGSLERLMDIFRELIGQNAKTVQEKNIYGITLLSKKVALEIFNTNGSSTSGKNS